MNAEEIIASGLLELYVYGSLSEEERKTVMKAIETYPEVQKEVEAIEASLITLGETVAPPLSVRIWNSIFKSISNPQGTPVRTLPKRNWAAISGWAAAILCVAGIFWMLRQNDNLQQQVNDITTENTELRTTMDSTQVDLAETNSLLELLRSKDFNTIILPGNDAVAPEAYAKVYYNAPGDIAYIDAKGLPEAPAGKVYQVWSLTLNPLTPTSIGLLDTATRTTGDVYLLKGIPVPEAFGITLEPAGGSETPTLEQLYTLGTVTP